LVLNAIVLWNTHYLDAYLTPPSSGGTHGREPANDADLVRLSPLADARINLTATSTSRLQL
jgi:hypothetical protein